MRYTHGPARHLLGELRCIAESELDNVMANWQNLTEAQAKHLFCYLTDEMEGGGMLSTDKAYEAGHSLGVERREARGVLKRLASQGISYYKGYMPTSSRDLERPFHEQVLQAARRAA